MTPTAPWGSDMFLALLVAEELLDLVPALFQPAQRQGQVGDRVPHHVVGVVAAQRDQEGPLGEGDGQAAGLEFLLQLREAFVDLDREDLAGLGEAGDRVGPQQPPGLDRDQVIADLLDLAEQVGGDHDGDAELRPDPLDEVEHGGAPGRIEPVGRLVEQQQPGVADQGLGQLDPLLHAGGIRADQAVPLLVQTDVTQRLGRAFLGHGGRQAGHPAEVGHELGRGHVGRQAVVLGHVPEQGPDRLAAGLGVVAEHLGLALGRRKEPEQDLDQGRLARAVGADQSGDPRRDADREPLQGDHVPRIYLGQRAGLDDGVADRPAGGRGWLRWLGGLVGWHGATVPAGGRGVIIRESEVAACRVARAASARRRGLHLQDDATGGRGGYGRYVRTTSDDPATRQRPPLTKRLGPKHWAALDYMAGGLTTLILFVDVKHALVRYNFPPDIGGTRYWPLSLAGPVAVLLVLAAGFAVALRRRHPVVMLGVLLVGSFLISTLTVPNASALIYFLPVAYVLYLVAATYEKKRDAVRVLVAVYVTLVAVAIVLMSGRGGAFNGSSLIPVVLCVIIAWGSGYSVRQRRRYAVRLQDEAASKAVAQERLRIARELHDVVAHSMSVIAVQAGYGQYVIDRQPGDARAALGAIQATSREALDEMRRMLGALRQADDADARADGTGLVPAGSEPGLHAGPAAPAGGAGAPLYPAPGLADLDRLVTRTAGAGVRVDVTRFGRPRDLPASIDLSAYRIVQEALTNVVKHARTSSCRVLLGYRDDELTIEVTDDGAGLPVPGMAGAGVRGQETAVPGGHGLAPEASRGVLMLDDAQ